MCAYTYRHLIFDKEVKMSHWRKDHIFSQQHWWDWTAAWRGLKLDSCLSHWTKPQQKPWHPESNKFSEEKTFEYRKLVPKQDPNRTDIQTKWGHVKQKDFCTEGHYHSSAPAGYRMGEILTSSTSDIRLVFRIYKELKKTKHQEIMQPHLKIGPGTK